MDTLLALVRNLDSARAVREVIESAYPDVTLDNSDPHLIHGTLPTGLSFTIERVLPALHNPYQAYSAASPDHRIIIY